MRSLVPLGAFLLALSMASLGSGCRRGDAPKLIFPATMADPSGGMKVAGASPAHEAVKIPRKAGGRPQPARRKAPSAPAPHRDSRSPEEPEPAGARGRGIPWAVVIGIDTYQDPDIPGLKSCVRDARLIAERLVRSCGYEPDRVLTMTDDQPPELAHLLPVRSNLRAQIKNWLENVKAGDTLLVFFSGYGLADQGRGFLAPGDADGKNLTESALPTDELKDLLSRCRASRKVLILDCGHAGSGKGAAGGLSGLEVGQWFRDAEGLITLASCCQGEHSHGWPARGHSLFSYVLAEGLGGAAAAGKGGVIDWEELYKYTYDNVVLTGKKELGVEQHPVYLQRDDVRGVPAPAPVVAVAEPVKPKPPPPGRIDLAVEPGTLEVGPGGRKALALVVRRDGVAGPVALHFRDVPEGVTIGDATVPEGEGRAEVAVSAGRGAKPGDWTVRVEGRAREARRDARFLLRVTPPPVDHLKRGEDLIVTADPGKAIAEFDAALNQGEDPAAALAGRAWARNELGDPTRAVSDCDRALELDPGLAAAYVRRSCAHRMNYEWDQALEDASQAIRLDPENAEAYWQRGFVSRLKGDPEAADADLRRADTLLGRAIERDRASARAFYLRGLVGLARQDVKRAVQDFTSALERAPGCARAYHGRGLAYRASAGGERDYERALKDLGKAIELAPRSARAYLDRGICLLSHRALDRALDDFKQAVKLSPEFALARFYRGIGLEFQGRSTEALDDLDEAIRLAPSCADAYLNRAAIRRKQRRFNDAFDDYSRLIALQPRGAEGYSGRGSVLLDLGKFARAVDDFTRAVALEPVNPTAYYARGSAYRNLERYDDALADYQRALDQGLSRPSATRALLFCGWRSFVGKEMPDQALAYINKVLERADDLDRTDLVEAYELRGSIYVARKDYTRAYADFDRALELDPQSKAKQYKKDAVRRELSEGGNR